MDLRGSIQDSDRDNSNSNTVSWKPNVIVLGPGGPKGFLELGALFALEKTQFISNVHTYFGVSVGAIICLLMVAGYTMREAIEKAADGNIFMGVDTIKVADSIQKKGLISNEPIKRRLSDAISEKFGYIPNLEQLHMISGLCFKTLSYDMDLRKIIVFDHETAPDLSCVDAAMYSMNIPLIFYILYYKNHKLVDGALGNPYPVNLVDNGKDNILGIYIDEIEGIGPEQDGLFAYVHDIIQAPMRALREFIISKSSSRCRHMKLITPLVGLDITAEQKANMLYEGIKTAEKFIVDIKNEISLEEVNRHDYRSKNKHVTFS
jgi:predicted acylesterase/phospholipase RssA